MTDGPTAPNVFDNPRDLIKMASEGDRVNIRYKTTTSNYKNEQNIEGKVKFSPPHRLTVTTEGGTFHVIGEGKPDAHLGEVQIVQPTKRQTIGVYHRGELLD